MWSHHDVQFWYHPIRECNVPFHQMASETGMYREVTPLVGQIVSTIEPEH